jgi:hypothetical protein
MTATPATRGWCGFRKQGVPGIREVGGSVQTGGARRGELRLYTRNPLPPDEDRTWTALDVAPDGDDRVRADA